MWRGGEVARTVEEGERNVKGWFLKSLGVDDVEGEVKQLAGTAEEKGDGLASGSTFVKKDPEDATGFWTRDEGLEEVRKNLKDA